jgi:type IV secretory pathway VirJ component
MTHAPNPSLPELPRHSVGRAQHGRASHLAVTILVLLSALACQCSAEAPVRTERLSYGQFTTLRMYLPKAAAGHLVLLISGDGGWGAGLDFIAQGLTAEGALVAGIDGADFLLALARSADSCASPAAQLDALTRYLSQRYHLPAVPPVVVGHSAGASLAFVAVAQSARGTFAGALTLSFCDEFDLRKPLCPAGPVHEVPRHGGWLLQPAGELPAPWIALHGLSDKVCPAPAARAFAAAIPGARFVGIPGVDHHYRDPKDWWAIFIGAYRELASAAPAAAPAEVATPTAVH